MRAIALAILIGATFIELAIKKEESTDSTKWIVAVLFIAFLFCLVRGI